MKNKVSLLIVVLLASSIIMTGCRPPEGQNKFVIGDITEKLSPKKDDYKNSGSDEFEIDMTEEEMYKLLEENGYGQGIDWSKQTDDDPSIPKSMDITSSKEAMEKAYRANYNNELELGDSYEKKWWEWFPATYNLSGDVFNPTNNYAGEEKQYNNSMQQNLVDENLTSGQWNDISIAQRISRSFVYEEMKTKYQWTDNLDELCRIADSLDIADFYSRESDRPMWMDAGEKWLGPGFMTAYYYKRTTGYDLIGIPQFSGYEFNITVWEKCDEPVGWTDDLGGTGFYNENEVYENMGEWDFYDELQATDKPKKIVKPKLPNGAMILKGETDNLSKEQYVYSKLSGGSGIIYYYGNGITVDMTFYGGKQGGNFEDALKYCQIICHNK